MKETMTWMLTFLRVWMVPNFFQNLLQKHKRSTDRKHKSYTVAQKYALLRWMCAEYTKDGDLTRCFKMQQNKLDEDDFAFYELNRNDQRQRAQADKQPADEQSTSAEESDNIETEASSDSEMSGSESDTSVSSY
mgnify:CR=1 FL=1